MAHGVDEVIEDAARLLVDTDNTHWTAAVLLAYLNEGQLLIAQMDDAASYIEESHTPVVDSAHQELPLRALRLLDITLNTTSKLLIRRVDKIAMDMEDPGWQAAASADDAQMWAPDETDNQSYYVYPPSTAASRYDVK